MTVSIIMPIYNRVRYLPSALKSIYAQDYDDYDVVVVDDGSQEDVQAALEQHRRRDKPPVRYIRQDNRGPAGARNHGVKEARGEVIAFHDSDDEWSPDFLSRTMAYIDSGLYDWVSTAGLRIALDENEEETGRRLIPNEPDEDFRALFLRALEYNSMGGPSQNVLKKICFEKNGYFREDLRIRDDWEMWLRLLQAGYRLKIIPEPLYHYKIRSDSITKTSVHTGLRNTHTVLRQYRDYALTLDPAFRGKYAELIWNIARHLKNRGISDPLLFFNCVVESARVDFNLKRMLKSARSVVSGKAQTT